MSSRNPNPDPTADYRKYPKGPNFLLIVVLSGVVIILVMVIAYFVLGSDARKMLPHGPNPTPNSLATPPALRSTQSSQLG